MGKIKELKEKRNELLIKATAIIDKAEEETRALTEEEEKEYNGYIKEIDGLSRTIKIIEEKRTLSNTDPAADPTAEEEIREFEQYCRGEKRALKVGTNGDLLPRTVADMIIKKIKDISPLYEKATKFNVRGELSIPTYDESTTAVTAAYVDELTELTEKSGELKVISLKPYIVGALSTISNKLINNADFDIVGFVVNEIAESLAHFAEKEGLTGTTKIRGIFPNVNKKVTAADDKLTADDIIKLQLSVPAEVQKNAVWLMHPTTFIQAKTLKAEDGHYLLVPDMVNGSGFTMLGKAVYISENAPEFAASTKVMVYGDLSGYVFNLSKEIETKVLSEKYATQYATGVVGYMEIDGAIMQQSKFAVLEMGAAASVG